ncbi:hypothetical protein KY312_00725 [Candidatus Woesearchaeota archaeon]|nr:hypothetical protein [Candidatus Woesearchaeota archaeon]
MQKDKVRFYYALKGREGKSGIVHDYSIEKLGRTVLLLDAKHEKDIHDFFVLWECPFSIKKIDVK